MLTRAASIDRALAPGGRSGRALGSAGRPAREVDPYLRPLYDALYDMMPAEQVLKRLSSGDIEIAPLAFMRGRTLAHSYVILDEAQNTTPMQMKMFLTRLGESSRMAVTGDLTQVDLPTGQKSGLRTRSKRSRTCPASASRASPRSMSCGTIWCQDRRRLRRP